jgi:hypothetical protein
MPILLRDGIVASTRHWKRLLPISDAAEQTREVFELPCHYELA